jgi:hypothetical protein
MLLASLSTASIHLSLGLQTGLRTSTCLSSAFLVALSSFIINTWPTHWSLLNLIRLVSLISVYEYRFRCYVCFAIVLQPAHNHRFSLGLLSNTCSIFRQYAIVSTLGTTYHKPDLIGVLCNLILACLCPSVCLRYWE